MTNIVTPTMIDIDGNIRIIVGFRRFAPLVVVVVVVIARDVGDEDDVDNDSGRNDDIVDYSPPPQPRKISDRLTRTSAFVHHIIVETGGDGPCRP